MLEWTARIAPRYNTVQHPATRSQTSHFPARLLIVTPQIIFVRQETFGILLSKGSSPETQVTERRHWRELILTFWGKACSRALLRERRLLKLRSPSLIVYECEAIIQFGSTRRGRESSRTDWVAVGANRFNGFAPTPSVHLFQDSMDVIPHRKLRKIQAGSDFLICEPSGHQTDQLLLAQSKFRP